MFPVHRTNSDKIRCEFNNIFHPSLSPLATSIILTSAGKNEEDVLNKIVGLYMAQARDVEIFRFTLRRLKMSALDPEEFIIDKVKKVIREKILAII